MAEPIEMQFGMLRAMGPGNHAFHPCRCPHRKGVWGCL